MNQIRIEGLNASGVLTPPKDLGVRLQSVEFGMPASSVGLVDVKLTMSGEYTGVISFVGDNIAEIQFKKNEKLILTTTNFAADFSVTVRYILYGDMQDYMSQNAPGSKLPIPARLR